MFLIFTTESQLEKTGIGQPGVGHGGGGAGVVLCRDHSWGTREHGLRIAHEILETPPENHVQRA